MDSAACSSSNFRHQVEGRAVRVNSARPLCGAEYALKLFGIRSLVLALGGLDRRHTFDTVSILRLGRYGRRGTVGLPALYSRKVHRSFTATSSWSGIRPRSCGESASLSHERFQTMKRSFPGLSVQRNRVLLPRFLDSVSYRMKLVSTRFGLQAYVDCSCHRR